MIDALQNGAFGAAGVAFSVQVLGSTLAPWWLFALTGLGIIAIRATARAAAR